MSEEDKFVEFISKYMISKRGEIKRNVVCCSGYMGLKKFREELSKYGPYYKAWTDYSWKNQLNCSSVGDLEWWKSNTKLKAILTSLNVNQYVEPINTKHTFDKSGSANASVTPQLFNFVSLPSAPPQLFNPNNNSFVTLPSEPTQLFNPNNNSFVTFPSEPTPMEQKDTGAFLKSNPMQNFLVEHVKRSELIADAYGIINRCRILSKKIFKHKSEKEEALEELLFEFQLNVDKKNTNEQLTILSVLTQFLANLITNEDKTTSIIATDTITSIKDYSNIISNTISTTTTV